MIPGLWIKLRLWFLSQFPNEYKLPKTVYWKHFKWLLVLIVMKETFYVEQIAVHVWAADPLLLAGPQYDLFTTLPKSSTWMFLVQGPLGKVCTEQLYVPISWWVTFLMEMLPSIGVVLRNSTLPKYWWEKASPKSGWKIATGFLSGILVQDTRLRFPSHGHRQSRTMPSSSRTVTTSFCWTATGDSAI